MLNYYPAILRIFELKVIYKLIKRYIFFEIENVKIIDIISHHFYAIIDINNEEHEKYVKKLIKQLISKYFL